MNNFNFKVLTPNGTIIDKKVEKVIITTLEGEITVLKNHIPLIAVTKKGRLVVYAYNTIEEYVADSGILKVNKEETILMSNKIEN